jgi:hypothetical protein
MPLKKTRLLSPKIEVLLEEIQRLRAFVERNAQSQGLRAAHRNGGRANGSMRRKGRSAGSRYLNGSS